MREIKYIAVHCTGGSQRTTIKELLLEFRRLGWNNPGYHYVVSTDGTITQLQPEEKPSNGVRGFNRMTVNVAYIGGLDAKGKYADTRTPRAEGCDAQAAGHAAQEIPHGNDTGTPRLLARPEPQRHNRAERVHQGMPLL